MNIRAVAHILPRADRSSGERRFVSLLGAIATEHRVTLLVVDDLAAPMHQRGSGPRSPALGATSVRVLSGPLLTALRQERPDVVVFEFYSPARRLLALVRAWRPEASVVIGHVGWRLNSESASSGGERRSPNTPGATEPPPHDSLEDPGPGARRA